MKSLFWQVGNMAGGRAAGSRQKVDTKNGKKERKKEKISSCYVLKFMID